MNSLKVPESGLQLEGSTGKDATLPSQAFALSLSDVLIEDMIKCVQNGDGIQLSLGANPVSLTTRSLSNTANQGKLRLETFELMFTVANMTRAPDLALRFQITRHCSSSRLKSIRPLPHTSIRIDSNGRKDPPHRLSV